MSSKRKYWLAILIFLTPHILYSFTLFDAVIEYFTGENFFAFSYPFYLLIEPINYLLGNPEGFGLSLILGNLIYPAYSFIVLLIFLLFTWTLYQKEKRKYLSYIAVTIMITLLPILVTTINSSLSYASYKRENTEILESHSNLKIVTYEASFTANEITIPIEIQGLKPENQNYLIEVLLSDKDKGNLGSITYQAEYTNNDWNYITQLNNIEQDGNKILLKYKANSDRYSKENLEMLVDIHQDFNLFYSKSYDVKTI